MLNATDIIIGMEITALKKKLSIKPPINLKTETSSSFLSLLNKYSSDKGKITNPII